MFVPYMTANIILENLNVVYKEDSQTDKQNSLITLE